MPFAHFLSIFLRVKDDSQVAMPDRSGIEENNWEIC